MIIRKEFRVEGSHVVRNCSTRRCSEGVAHGHSAVIEVFLTAQGLDEGQMLVDFGLMKGTIKDFIDSFDHCHSFWRKEDEEYKNFFKNHGGRWVEMPCSPSAEMYSLMMFYVIDKIIENTQFANGEQFPKLHAVRYHETTTGYAEASREDLAWWKYTLEDIVFSDRIIEEWQDSEMWNKLIDGVKFINKTPVHYID